MELIKVLSQLYALHHTRGIGVKSAKALVDAFGDLNSVFQRDNIPIGQQENPKSQALRAELNKSFSSIMCRTSAERELAFMSQKNVALLQWGTQNYPELLSECRDAPLGLMIRGSIPKSSFWISVVGTRRATPLGIDFCQSIIRD